MNSVELTSTLNEIQASKMIKVENRQEEQEQLMLAHETSHGIEESAEPITAFYLLGYN